MIRPPRRRPHRSSKSSTRPTLIPEFRGFEAYYKFYSSDQPRQENYTTREELENPSAGFHRIHSLGKTTTQVKPLISVDVADRNTVFMTLLNFYYLVQTPYGEYQGISPRPIDVRRSATDTLGDTMSFDRADLDPADADLTGVNWTQVGIDQQLFLVVYAISYGLKDYSTPLYSTAKYLGYMSYTID